MISRVDADIRTRYLSWIDDMVRVERHATGWCELSLPFVGRHNDLIGVYIREEHDDLIVSDLGETLVEMSHVGWDPNSESNKTQLAGVLERFDVSLNDGRLEVRGSEEALPWLVQRLGQAILAIEGLST